MANYLGYRALGALVLTLGCWATIPSTAEPRSSGVMPRATPSSLKVSSMKGRQWKKLSPHEKSLIVESYLFGWQQAGAINQLAIAAANKEPHSPVSAVVKSLQPLYVTSNLPSMQVVKDLDIFFSRAQNKDRSLAEGIAAVRAIKDAE